MRLPLSAVRSLAAAALLAGPAHAQPAPRLVTVVAESAVLVAPDGARIGAGVVTQGKTAREALDANSRAVAEAIKALRDSGIADTDIRTAGISLQPVTSYPSRDEPNRPPRIVGFQAANQLTVRVAQLARLGDLLDRIVGAGINQISDIQFLVSDAESRRDGARGDAVKEARRKAELYAAAAGARLGRVHAIDEASEGVQPVQVAMRAGAEAVPIAPGASRLSVRVTVTWELEN